MLKKILLASIIITLTIGIGFTPNVTEAKTTLPTWDMDGFWWLDNDATGLNVEDNTGYGAADDPQETHITGVVKDTIIRLRVDISETANQNQNITIAPRIEYQVGNAACTAGGTWTTITTSLANAWALADSATITNGDITDANRIALQTKAFGAGGQLLDTSNPASAITYANSSREWEFSIKATTNATDNQIYTFRITNNGSVLNAYSLPTADDCPNATTATANNPPIIIVNQPDGTGDTVNVGDLYNINYDLSDGEDAATVDFYYDVDGVGLNGTAITGCQDQVEGAGATCAWDTTGMTPDTYFVYGIATDGVNPTQSDYSSGEVTINAPAVVPDAISYTNNIESGLNNLGARTGQEISLSGTDFGTVNAGSRATCGGGAGTGCVQIGGYTIPDGNFSVWNLTTITFTIPAAITSYGTTITVTSASQSDTTPLNFKVYPDITSISVSEAREGDTITTISGTRFGTGAGANAVTIDGVAATGCVWGDTSITNCVVPSAINDANNSVTVRVYQGTGGDNALYDDSAGFTILPSITSITNCNKSGFPAGDFAREYNASDSACPNNLTDGAVIINGNHFGATGSVTILGGAMTQSAVTGFCGGSAYSATCIAVQLTAANIGNGAGGASDYTGSTIITRTSDSKTDTRSGFRVLPRITGIDPTQGVSGTDVTISGDHLCSGTCPSLLSDWNDVADDGWDVEWGTNDVSVLSPIPTHTIIYADTPSLSSGAYSVTVTSGGGSPYTSNGIDFTVQSSEPNAPTNLYQMKTKNDLGEPPASHTPWTGENPDGKLAAGGGFNQTNVWLRATADAPVNSTGLCIEVEVKPVASGFDGTGAVLSSDADGCKAFSIGSPEKLFVQVTGLSEGSVYKWRSRIKNNQTGAYGNWTDASVDGSGKSFYIDASAPTSLGTCSLHSSVTSSGATISWAVTDAMSSVSNTYTEQVQYSSTTGFTSFVCSAGSGTETCGTPTSGLVSNPQINLTGLSPNSVYYYRARSKDAAGNEKIAGYGLDGQTACTFTTSKAETRTTEFYVTTESISGGGSISRNFNVFIPEDGYSIQSAFIELSGVFGIDATTPAQVSMYVNSQNQSDYSVNTSDSVSTSFNIIHNIPADNLNVSTPSNPNNANTLHVILGGSDPSVSIAAAKIVVTYYHTPVQ